MSTGHQKIAAIFGGRLDQGPLSEELATLLEANITDNLVESVMRLRALAEVSRHLDTLTLLGMAAAAERRGPDVADIVCALTGPLN